MAVVIGDYPRYGMESRRWEASLPFSSGDDVLVCCCVLFELMGIGSYRRSQGRRLLRQVGLVPVRYLALRLRDESEELYSCHHTIPTLSHSSSIKKKKSNEQRLLCLDSTGLTRPDNVTARTISWASLCRAQPSTKASLGVKAHEKLGRGKYCARKRTLQVPMRHVANSHPGRPTTAAAMHPSSMHN